MRLINARTFKLESFLEEATRPRYGILSHTWDGKEVIFQDIQRSDYQVTSTKILGCCAQALKDGLQWVWIDSCCIDKTSSSELSEAINSMYKWYARASRCYAYLSDVPSEPERKATKAGEGRRSAPIEEGSAFQSSRWFTRGWTLQELIAPREVFFYTQSWDIIDTVSPGTSFVRGDSPSEFLQTIVKITGVHWRVCIWPEKHLKGTNIATRMSWASRRITTKPEDMAYCLLGLFDINIPLLYGEGGEKAFSRLQEEIMRIWDDQTLLLWNFGKYHVQEFEALGDRDLTWDEPLEYRTSSGEIEVLQDGEWPERLFAVSPSEFAGCGDLFSPGLVSKDQLSQTMWRVPPARDSHYSMTNKGLLIDMPIIKLPDMLGMHATHYGVLNYKSHSWSRTKWYGQPRDVAIPLRQVSGRMFSRCAKSVVCEMSSNVFSNVSAEPGGIYILRGRAPHGRRAIRPFNDAFAIARFFPPYIPTRQPDVADDIEAPVLKEFYMLRTAQMHDGLRLSSDPATVSVPGHIFACYEYGSVSVTVHAAYRHLEEYLSARQTLTMDEAKATGELEDTDSAKEALGLVKGSGRMQRLAHSGFDQGSGMSLLAWLLLCESHPEYRDDPSQGFASEKILHVGDHVYLDAQNMQWGKSVGHEKFRFKPYVQGKLGKEDWEDEEEHARVHRGNTDRVDCETCERLGAVSERRARLEILFTPGRQSTHQD